MTSPPKKPMTSYNIFFQDERQKMLDEHQKKGEGRPDFTSLAQEISKRWRAIKPQDKAYYDRLAVAEKEKFAAKLIEWHEKKNGTASCAQESGKEDPEKGTKEDHKCAVKCKAPSKTRCEAELSEEAEDDFSLPTFGAKFYDLDMNVCETNDTFHDLNPIPYQADAVPDPPTKARFAQDATSLLSLVRGLSACNSNDALRHNRANPFLVLPTRGPSTTRPILGPCPCQRMHSGSHHQDGQSPGSIDWVAKELGDDGIRMLASMFAEN